ncbi:MAG: hypothetical protein JSS93_11025 [Bacteroidetes bacterium]|nr:hypothetical protein [Bacteroidota bacterium]
MSKIKLKMFFGLLIALICGCSKSNVAPTVPATCQVASLVVSSTNSTNSANYTFTYGQDNKILSVSSGSTTYSFSYNQQGRISTINLGQKIYPVLYDGSGRIVSIINFSGAIYDSAIFGYNSNNQLIKYIRAQNITNTQPPKISQFFQYPNLSSNNFSSITFTFPGQTQQIQVQAQYDSKSNYITGSGLGVLALYISSGYYTTNNITKMTFSSPGFSAVSSSSYAYNSSGYPISIDQTYQSSSSPTTTSQTTLVYTNCK